MNTPTRAQLEQAKKFPWQWAVIILLSAVVALFGINNYTNQQRLAAMALALSRKDSIIGNWQERYLSLSNELLYKNNIIDRQQKAIDNTDSIARKKLERPAKQIVKQQ